MGRDQWLAGVLPGGGFPCTTIQVLDSTADSIPRLPADSLRAEAASNYIPSYPNPASSQAGVDVALTQPAMISIRVYSSMGNPVLTTSVAGQQGINHLQVPLGKLETGIYYIQVQYGNVSRMSKIQKL